MAGYRTSDVRQVGQLSGLPDMVFVISHSWRWHELCFTGSMSLARPIMQNAQLMLTRRMHGREFRLRPCGKINAIIRYVVAVVARRTGIRLHSIVALSNHWHVCLTDFDGRICEFTRDCHAFIARAVNAEFGDFESIWASEQTSLVTCVEPSDLLAKIAYSMANPVEAGLVAHGKNWPGVRVSWPARPQAVRRPTRFFRDEAHGGTWPAVATLEMSRPPGYDELSDDELAAVIENAIEEREASFRVKAQCEGKGFLGRRAVLRQSRYKRPATQAPRFGLSPRVACRNKWRRIERLRSHRDWLSAYASAFSRWIAGEREVQFPYGTYKMRVLHRVACEPAPT